MKNKNKAFLLMPIALAPLFVNASFYFGRTDVTSEEFGNYSATHTTNEKYTLHVETDYTGLYGITYIYYNANINLQVKQYTTTKKKASVRDFELTVPFSVGFQDGFIFEVRIQTSSGMTMWSRLWTIYPTEKADQLIGKNNVISSSKNMFYGVPTSFHIDQNVIVNTTIFNFKETSTYFLCDRYYRLIIDNIWFTTDRNDTFTYESCYLVIEDTNNAFPYLGKKSDGKIYINLSIKQKTGNLTFYYNDFFFVSESTLEMSTYARLDSYFTTNFYLPKNKKTEVQNDKFSIMIKKAGTQKENFIINIDYITDLNLIGDAGDSEYYLKGGVFN